MESERKGKRVRIITSNGYHYSGIILGEDDLFITILDKFQKEVSLRKDNLEVLEVSNGV